MKKQAKQAKQKQAHRARHVRYTDWLTEERLTLLTTWARAGLINTQIAENIGIHPSTLQEWKKEHPEIAEALNTGAREADAVVENALYIRTQGRIIKLKRPYKLKERVFDKETGKCIKETERLEYGEYEDYTPPDTTAQIFWLKNRLPEKWRDKIAAELGGKVEHVEHLTPEETALLEKAMKRLEQVDTNAQAD